MVKIHPVFYTLVLRPAAPILDALPRQIQDPPPIRARRGFKEDSKEQYKFYLNLRVYSSCREQDVA